MNKEHLFKHLFIGIALAISFCLSIGAVLHFLESELTEYQQELMEGIVGIAAICVLIWMIFWMRKAGKHIKGEIEEKLDESKNLSENKFAKVLVSMAFFAVLREGIESVLFLFNIPNESGLLNFLGGIMGLLVAASFGYLIFKGSKAINIAHFFKVSSIAIIVFAAGLLAGSLHAFAEIKLITIGQSEVWDTSNILENKSFLGTILKSLIGYDQSPALLEVVAYVTFLVVVLSIFIYTNPSKNKKVENIKL